MRLLKYKLQNSQYGPSLGILVNRLLRRTLQRFEINWAFIKAKLNHSDTGHMRKHRDEIIIYITTATLVLPSRFKRDPQHRSS